MSRDLSCTCIDYDELHRKVLPLGTIEVLVTVPLLSPELDQLEYPPRPVCLWEVLEVVVPCASYQTLSSVSPSAVYLFL